MGKRLNIERQEMLEPERMEYAKKALQEIGIKELYENETHNCLKFYHKKYLITFFPYSGWHTGKSIKDGRGLQKLLNQLK